jgi:D-alanine-D-alanine ligase-like ATP-grasp enzyme
MRKQVILPLIFEICKELGIKTWVEPTRGVYGYLQLNNGYRFYVKDINFNINLAASVGICKNKAACSSILEHLGYSVPLFTIVRKKSTSSNNSNDSLESGLAFICNVKFPVILKPNDLSQGRLIFKVQNEKEYFEYSETILNRCSCFQVQKFYQKNDYRIVVLDGKPISVYQRIPLFVVGNGFSDIENLVLSKQEYFHSIGRDTCIKPDDKRIQCKIRNLGLSMDYIPSKGEKLILQDISNLCAGGETVELTDKIHPAYTELSRRIATDMNLNLCGIDIMTNDITSDLSDYVILEINSSPGLDNYAYQGEEQEIYVKNLYRKIILFIAQNYGI